MMHFWGVEVKNGSTVKVQPGEDKVVHMSQACLGDVKKDKENEFIRLYVQKSDQKFVIGMLSLKKFPHINLDLIFEDDFELSHDWKHGSVHFAGYKADNLNSMPDEDESDDDDLEELVPIDALNNEISERKDLKASDDKANSGAKSDSSEGKPKVRIVEPPKAAKKSKDDDDTEDEDEDESDEYEDGDEEEEDEEMADESGSDDDDSDEEESDEDTPKKSGTSKKRPLESASTPSVPDKKAKFSTPQKKAADGKKMSGHVATPHPAKHAGKTPANAEKSNKQTPKSGGSFPCSSCDRTFGSEQAVQSHSKAKHGAK